MKLRLRVRLIAWRWYRRSGIQLQLAEREIADFLLLRTLRLWPYRKAVVRRGAALLLGIVLATGISESMLRWKAIPLPPKLGNSLFGCYDLAHPLTSIYYHHPDLGVRLSRPNFETECYWNGYWWDHQSDAYGFRNPATYDRPDVIVLGDSFVYGHGVSERQTIPHFMRGYTGATVANLGMTANGPAHYAALVSNFAPLLRPRVVLILYFSNDFVDVQTQRSLADVQHTLDTGEAQELKQLSREQLVEPIPPAPGLVRTLGEIVLTLRTINHYIDAFQDRRGRVDGASLLLFGGLASLVFAQDDSVTEQRADSHEATYDAYVRKITSSTVKNIRSAGALPVFGFIPSQENPLTEQDHYVLGVVRDMAQADGVPFVDTTPALLEENGDGVPGIRLKGDGHFSEGGNRLVARYVSDFLVGLGYLEGTRTR